MHAVLLWPTGFLICSGTAVANETLKICRAITPAMLAHPFPSPLHIISLPSCCVHRRGRCEHLANVALVKRSGGVTQTLLPVLFFSPLKTFTLNYSHMKAPKWQTRKNRKELTSSLLEICLQLHMLRPYWNPHRHMRLQIVYLFCQNVKSYLLWSVSYLLLNDKRHYCRAVEGQDDEC